MGVKKELTVKSYISGTNEEITDEMLDALKDRILATQDRSMANIGYFRVEDSEMCQGA